jgi:hypothetical protein
MTSKASQKTSMGRHDSCVVGGFHCNRLLVRWHMASRIRLVLVSESVLDGV